MDDKDIKILNLLRADGRASIKEISEKTGVRPSTVHQRIKGLKQQGVIQKFTLKLANDKVGEGFIVLMLVKTKPNIHLGNKVLNNPHVKEIFGVTGEYDLLFKMKFADVNEFNQFIIKFRKEEDILSTLTMVATANLKEEL